MELANQNSHTLPLVLIDDTGNVINIEIRPNGYVNATKLCQAMGKEWKNYYKSKGTGEFLAELSKYENIPVEMRPVPFGTGQISSGVVTNSAALVQIGISRTQPTWVHPDVAIHLAQWASARFGVAVSRLVRRYQTGQVTTHESINASIELAQNVSVVDDEQDDEVPAIEAGWSQSRMDSIHVTKAKNEVVRTSLHKPAVGDYAKLANISNQLALNFHGTTKRFKSDHKIPPKYSLPDVMNKTALARRVIAECGMGAHLRHNSQALAIMTEKQRNESFQKRKEEIKIACDILVMGEPGIIPVSEADEKKRSLNLKRKAGEIEPSYEARLLLAL